MRVWSAIFNVFALVLLMIFSITFFHQMRVYQRDFDQARLDAAIDLAAKAAFSKSVEDYDVAGDYPPEVLDLMMNDPSSAIISPFNVLDTFETIMCLNYDMSPSVDNKDYIESFIPTAIFTANDGFYVANTVNDDRTPENGIDGGEYRLRWGVKQPYTYEELDGDGNLVGVWAVNVLNGKRYGINPANGKLMSANTYMSNLNKDDIRKLTNDKISSAVAVAIRDRNTYFNDSEFKYKFYLPSQTTLDGVNPMNGPGFLIFMQNVDFASDQKIDAVSVSGYQLKNRQYVIGFREILKINKDNNGNITSIEQGSKMCYCYGYQLPKDIRTAILDKPDTKYFLDADNAAREGYRPAYSYLTRASEK